MPRTNTVVDFSSGKQEVTLVAMSASEEARIDAEEAQYLAEKPMREWKESMAETDSEMPRIWEDFLTLNGTDGWPQITKDRHISKVALRATKPEAS